MTADRKRLASGVLVGTGSLKPAPLIVRGFTELIFSFGRDDGERGNRSAIKNFFYSIDMFS
jgi:hypothetical protein